MGEVYAGQLGEARSISTADGGTALTTTVSYIQFPAIANGGESRKGHLFITPRNFSTAVVAKWLPNPFLTVLVTTNGMATHTDYSVEAQDASTSTSVTLSSLPAYSTTGGFMLIGSHEPFGGAYFDMDGANSAAGTALTVYFSDTVGWSSASATVTGVTSSVALDQDGLVYWTPSSLWKPKTLRSLYPYIPKSYYSDIPMFWTQWRCDAALDTSTTVDSITAYNRSTAYVELIEGQAFEERIQYGFGGFGCIQALTNAGTANLIVNLAQAKEGAF